MKFLAIVVLFLGSCNYCLSQKRNDLQLLKLSWDNDFFNLRGEGTDRGYTNGLNLEVYYTKHAPPRFLSKLLMAVKDTSDNIYGWGVTQKLYTPIDISKKEVQPGDRPYAGVLYLSHLLISSDHIKKQKLTTSVSFGVIGKYAFGEEVQTWVHRLIHYQLPKGWDNQIANDIVLTYFINYEKEIFSPSKNLQIIGNVMSTVGTLNNNVAAGLQFRAGLLTDYFSNYERPTYSGKSLSVTLGRKFQFYFYMKTDITEVMDNSTLQGGFFSHDASPYVIRKDDITRAFMQYEYGIVIAHKRFGFNVHQKLRTAEFKDYYTQQIGNLTFYFGL